MVKKKGPQPEKLHLQGKTVGCDWKLQKKVLSRHYVDLKMKGKTKVNKERLTNQLKIERHLLL